MHSYAGRVLHVDLTSRTVCRLATEEHLARAFLGGRGLNLKRLFDGVPPHTDGLSPANLLIAVRLRDLSAPDQARGTLRGGESLDGAETERRSGENGPAG